MITVHKKFIAWEITLYCKKKAKTYSNLIMSKTSKTTEIDTSRLDNNFE